MRITLSVLRIKAFFAGISGNLGPKKTDSYMSLLQKYFFVVRQAHHERKN